MLCRRMQGANRTETGLEPRNISDGSRFLLVNLKPHGASFRFVLPGVRVEIPTQFTRSARIEHSEQVVEVNCFREYS